MPTGNGATDVNGASQRLSALLSEPLPTEEEQTEVQDEPEQDQEVEAEASQAETENEPEETPEGDTEPERYKVKVNGEELEVTLEEMQKGYMMDADYRKKTMGLSKEREAVEAKAAEVDKQLEDARLLVEEEVASLDTPEMQELKELDPEAYIKQYEKVQKKVKKFEALKDKRQKEAEDKRGKLIEKEREALFMAFPEWQDQKVMAKEFPELLSTWKDYGYTDQELNNITDHRMLVVAQKLKQLDKLTKLDLESKKVKTKPKTIKPGTPKTKQDREDQSTRSARDQLKRSGNMRDAVKLLSL